MSKQLYILDTNILIHDPNSIYNFDEHDVYIPLACIDDLDELKTKQESAGWSAREVFRVLDQFNLRDLTTKGAALNGKGGRLYIHNSELPNKNDIPNITRVNSDNAIINSALHLQGQNPKKKVTIVTKDCGLRIRANSWGCQAENYQNDLIEDDIYTGMRYVDIESQVDWDLLWASLEVEISSLSEDTQSRLKNHLYPNEFVIFSWGEQKIPTWYRKGKLVVLKDKSNGNGNGNGHGNGKPRFMGICAKNIEQKAAIEALSDDSISLVNLCGPAGTGKSLLSIAVSLQKVFDGKYDRLIVIKPIIPFGGRDLGALPGDKWEKLYEWMSPIKDNMLQLLPTKSEGSTVLSLEELVKDEIVEVEAMSYIQGRSIPNSIVLLEEAQNVSPREGRMVVERCGKNSKIILLGDLSQVENSYLDSRSCGLAHAMQGSRDKEFCAVVTLKKVERSQLSAIASEIFNKPEARR